MPRHDKHSVRDKLEDELYSSADLSVAVPNYKFPDAEQDPRHAYAVVHDELMLDGNSRQNLATFCQAWGSRNVGRALLPVTDRETGKSARPTDRWLLADVLGEFK